MNKNKTLSNISPNEASCISTRSQARLFADLKVASVACVDRVLCCPISTGSHSHTSALLFQHLPT